MDNPEVSEALKALERRVHRLEVANRELRDEQHNMKAVIRRMSRLLMKLDSGKDAFPPRLNGRVPLPTLQNKLRFYTDEEDDQVNPVAKKPALLAPRPTLLAGKPRPPYRAKAQGPDEQEMTYRDEHVRTIIDCDFSTQDTRAVAFLDVMSSDVPLFEDIEFDGKNQPAFSHMYFVRTGTDGPHLGMPVRNPGWPYGVDAEVFNRTFNKEIAFGGCVLELQPNSTSASVLSNRTSGSFARHKTLPAYVHELGEVFMRSTNHKTGSTLDARSTFCHLVVDVCSKTKALWLVYRYKGVEKGEKLQSPRKFERDRDMFRFAGTSQKFDICQVAESSSDWLTEHDIFKLIRNAQDLIKKTYCRAEPDLVTPKYREFLQEFQKVRTQVA